METAEVMAWFFFLVIISILFFAAFGSSNIDEATIEEYMSRLMEQEKDGGRR